MTARRLALPTILTCGAFALGAILSGCAPAGTSPVATTASADQGASPTTAPAPAAAGTLKACDVVTSSMLYATLKITVPDGVADNAETCTYKADGITIVVQTTSQASMYFPQSVYSASAVDGSIDLTGGDISYGYYLPAGDGGTLGNVHLFVAKGEKAVFVTGNALTPGTTQDVLNLATAVALAF